METIKLIQKNLKILFRSKISSLIVLVGPLLVIILAGLAFNNSLSYNIKISTYSEGYSNLAEKFLDNLGNDFEVTRFDSKPNCIESLEKGYHSCIIIPPDLQIVANEIKKIDFYIDNSKVNIASYIEQRIYETLKQTNSEISSDLTGELVATTLTTKEEINNNNDLINNEIERLKKIISRIENSKTISANSNLNLNTESLELNDLIFSVGGIRNELSKIDNIAKDSISEFKTAINNIENLNISNSALTSEINYAQSEINDLEKEYKNFSTNQTHIRTVERISSTINKEIENLDKNLEDARKNKQDVESNLDFSSLELKQSQTNIEEMEQSFNRILGSIDKNQILSADSIVTPVNVKKHHIVSGSGLTYLFPNLIILVLMILAITMSASQIIQDRLSKANLRILMTPVSFNKRLFASFLTNMLILLLQLGIILIAIHYLFNIDIFSSIFQIISVLLIMSVFFTLLGIIIGYIFNSEQTTLLGSVSVASLLFIVSDLILPLESMPQYMITIISKTPFVLGTDLLRRVMFFGAQISVENHRFLILYSFVLLLIILIWNMIRGIIRKINAKRMIS
jgi:ABC-type multidrug transport system permease subunit